MAKWTQIEVGGGKSQDSAQDTEDSLNEDTVQDSDEDNQDENQEDINYEEEDNVDFATSEDDQDEDSGEEEGDSEGSQEESDKSKKPSRAEERIRQLVADKKASDERARQAEARASALEQRAVATEKLNLDSEIVSTKAALDRVKQDLKAAVEAGDTDALIKGQEALSEHKVKLMALESSKNNFDAEQKKNPPKKQQEERQSGQVPQKALDWAEKNDGWFNKNRALTGTALGINQELLEEGHDPESPAFYAELDRRLTPFKPKTDTPPKDKSKTEALKSKSTPVVGSSSKTIPPKSVKVTPQDQEKARRLGIDPKRYLKQKAEYERNSQNSVSTFKPIFISKDKK